MNISTYLSRTVAVASAVFLLLCFFWPAHAEPKEDASIELVERLQALNALSGEFHQRQFDSEDELLNESSGGFLMQRPGLLRWETKEPFPQLLVTNGQSIWMYDPDLEQVTVSKVAQQLSQTPAVIFSGELDQLNRHYTVSSSSSNRFQLTPRNRENEFQNLQLVFDQGVISEMILLDGFGQTTEFKLTNVVNVDEKPIQDFDFTPPEGSDVFYQ